MTSKPVLARSSRLPLAVLVVGAFTTALNVTVLSPLLKLIAADFAVSDAAAGQLATTTAVGSGLAALLVAPWLDRHPRRSWLRVEAVLLGAGTLLTVLAPSFGWLFLGRALAGVGGGFIFAICLAAVGDLYPDPTRRNRAIGIVGTAATLGAVIGLPGVNLVATVGGWRWALATIIPLAAILIVGAARLPQSDLLTGGSLRADWARGYRRVLANRETMALLGVLIALAVVWFGWLIYFGAFAATAFGIGAGTLGLLFLVAGATQVVGNNLAPVLVERHSARTVALGATAVLTADLLAVGLLYTQPWTLFPFIAVASVASMVFFTCCNILLLDSLPAARGAVMALQSAGFEFGGALGAALVGVGLTLLGEYQPVYRWLGALLALAVVPLLLLSRRGAAVTAEAGRVDATA